MATTYRDFGAEKQITSPVVNPTDGKARVPRLIVVAIACLLLPAEFDVGSLNLSPSKVLFLIAVPILLLNLFRGAYGKVVAPDYLVLAYTFWMSLSVFINNPSVAAQYVGSNNLVLLGGYLVARAAIRDKQSAAGLAYFLAYVVLFSIPFVVYESITGHATIVTWLDNLPGIGSYTDKDHDPRLGLWRSQWAFVHPIHYGLFCSLALSLYFTGLADQVGALKRTIVAMGVAIACFASVSSGPFLALAAQIALTGWVACTGWAKSRWTILWTILIIAYIPIELGSNRFGLYAIVERVSFSPDTAFIRKLLFDYGTAQVARTPIFGVGFNPFPLPFFMTGSLDNFWLALAIRFGMPAFLFLFCAVLWGMIAAGKRDFSHDPFLNNWRRAWIFTMVSMILSLSTVAVWSEMYSITLFMIGCGMWMLTDPATPPAAAVQPSTPNESTQFVRERQSARVTGADNPYTRFPNGQKPKTGRKPGITRKYR